MTVSPFRIGPEQNATVVDSVDHSTQFARLSFEEEVEMLDAYNIQCCQAVVGRRHSLRRCAAPASIT